MQKYKSDNELIFEQYNKNIVHSLLLESNNNNLILTKYFNNIHNIIDINNIHSIYDIESKSSCDAFMFDSYRKAINSNNYNKSIQSNDKRYSLIIADDLVHKQVLVDYIFNNVNDLIDYLNENSDDIIKNILHGNVRVYKYQIINRIGDELGGDIANKIKLPKYYSRISCSSRSNNLTKKVAKLCKGKTKSEIINLLRQTFPYAVVAASATEVYSINLCKESANIDFMKGVDSLNFYSMNDSDDCGVMEGRTGECCWFIPNIDVFKNNFRDFMYEQFNWVYGDKSTPDPHSYEEYKIAAFNICSDFGLSHSESIATFYGSKNTDYNISDSEFADLFECIHHP